LHTETYSHRFSALTENDLFEVLRHATSGSGSHRSDRIEGLEELKRRIVSDFIKDKNSALKILLDIAKIQGNNKPEFSLIAESLILLITKCEEVFPAVLDELKGKEERFFFCFSEVVLSLDYNRKRQTIKSLIDFLMNRDAVTGVGVNEVYNRLISLGNENFSKEIVKESSPYLDSSVDRICAIIFSVKLCAKFADPTLMTNMLNILDKSMKGYFDGQNYEIEQEVCKYIERVKDQQSLYPLLNLLKQRTSYETSSIRKALASVLDANTSCIEYVFERIYDERDRNAIDIILQSLIEMKEKIDIRKLLQMIRINWWSIHPTAEYMRQLLVKHGEQSKPVLLEIVRQNEKYEFALRCLKEIGVSSEELLQIFPKSPMLQIYDFLYEGSRKFPKDLNSLWKEKEKLGESLPGKITRLDHLLLHVFASFNFVTLVADPSQSTKGVDIVCFYPETLDLFIIGCTSGILKNDLANMDASVKKMRKEIIDLEKCSIAPIVVCSEIASISTSDEKYAAQNNIIIMQRHNIDVLLEMLNTNRESREAIKYTRSCKPSLEISRP
jgi:hypothetical protein